MEQALIALLADQLAGQVAGGEDAVICVARNAEPVELRLHSRSGPRCVRQQQHGAATLSETAASLGGTGEGVYAVVHDAPHVADPGIVPGSEWGDG